MQSLLHLLPSMLVSVIGNVTVIDEFEIGLHDILTKELLLSLFSCIQGQLILTTHNTNLMDSGLPKECFYVIEATEAGDKTINPIIHYDHKIHKNSSIQNQYLSGKYKGVPESLNLDFLSLLRDLDITP